MTEAEWLAATDPAAMLSVVSASASASRRQWLLFVVECCYIAWRNQGITEFEPSLDCVLQFADGANNFAEVKTTWGKASHFNDEPISWGMNMIYISSRVGDESLPTEATSALLRDIFGNPFRPVTFAPEWRTEAAVGIAAKMYDSREFGNMPVLADALQDAGCEDAAVLDHCREPGPHVRGCWVVDHVLGKA